MVKKSKIRFAQLKAFLEGMHFSVARDNQGWQFEHARSGTIFHFRRYRATDRVYELDLFLVRTQLDVRGMLSEDALAETAFKAAVAKAPA
ncbi:MAG TPA: hypothetical protein VNH11_26925 [Pirellulales bacterium]|nr:hypothetical protein [Pirellulales bacterium]